MKSGIARNLCTLAVAGALLFAGKARAALLLQTGDYSQTTDFSYQFTFNKFDSTLGTLNSVYLSLSGIMDTAGTVQNTDGPQNFSLALNSVITVALPTLSLSTTPAVSQNYSLGSGATGIFSHPGIGGVNATQTLTGGGMAPYQAAGGGTFNVSLSTLTGQIISGGGGNVNATLTTTDTAHFLIQYDYVPVPVPEIGTALSGALLLLPWSLTSLRLCRRKRPGEAA